MNSVQAEFKALQDNQRLLVVLIFSLVTVVIWVTISLITSQRSTSISPELQALAVPLNPNIDETVLSEIEQKRMYTDDELSNFPIYILPTGEQKSIFDSPTQTSSPSGQISGSSLSVLNTLIASQSAAVATNSAQSSP